MKELFSKRAKKIITTVSLSCFLCSPVSYVCSMNQASAAALNTNVAYEQQFNTVGFDKDDHWNRGRSDEDKDWKKPPPPRDDDRDDGGAFYAGCSETFSGMGAGYDGWGLSGVCE